MSDFTKSEDTHLARAIIGIGCLALAAACAGCDNHPALPRVDTGAEAVAKSFFEALVRTDWPAAYDTLDPDSRARMSLEQFAGQAQAAMRHVGFTPADVSVAVSEKGDEASAVGVFRGAGGKHYKDGAALRRTAGGWGIVIRPNFGMETSVPARKK